LATQTRTATQTSTLSKVLYVTRKVQADLFAIVDTYGQISQDYAENLIHDFRLMLDEEVIDRIDLLWTKASTNEVVGAYIYTVVSSDAGLVDDRSGGIRYDPSLVVSNFGVRIYYNERWRKMSDSEKATIRNGCHFPWGPGAALDFGRGTKTADRTYSKEGYGLGRERFAGW